MQAQTSSAVDAGAPADPDELLQRVARHDQVAFAALYDLTAGAVLGTARRVLRDPTHAQDVAQEVFVEVWRKAPTYDAAKGSATTWLLTMAHRRAIDRVRSVQASRDRDDRVARRDLDIPRDVVWDEVAESTEHADVRVALRQLSDLQREALYLTYYRGLTYREAAEQLDRPLGTIKSRIRDGLRHLGEELAPQRVGHASLARTAVSS